MATLGTSAFTLSDWAKRLDPKGKIAETVNLLSQDNEMLDDMLWREGNLPTGERVTIQTGLPSVYWGLIGQGTPESKSTTAQVDEQCGILSGRSKVDVRLARLNSNVSELRLSEGKTFLEAMNQEMQQTMIYGAASSPEEFVGLANRYSSLSANNGQNIVSAGGSGSDNSSIYLVGWGEKSVYGIFPKGTKAGVMHEDLGVQDAFDSNSYRFRAYMDYWEWSAGLVVKDWRYCVRIANIDISALIADGAGSSVKLIEYMLKALHRLPTMAGIKPVFYANRTVKEMLDIQSMNKANVYLNTTEAEGRLKTTFRGVPIRTVDALTEAEAAVT